MTAEDTVYQALHDYMHGYAKFRDITNSPANVNTGIRYRKYLGMPENMHIREWFTYADDEQRRHVIERAKQLLGPHGYTIYMAWRAQCLK